MFVLIGLPVFRREWILPKWFEYIEAQDFPLEDLGFLFNVDPNDMATIKILQSFYDRHPELKHFEFIETHSDKHSAHEEGTRLWNKDQYSFMVKLRNQLLHRVSEINPDRYFSLDSDVLLESPRTISELVQLTASGTGIDAVSPLMFMMPDNIVFPNSMTWMNGTIGDKGYRHTHYPFGSLFKSDIIMAAVMMSQQVFRNARYEWHEQGEDLGWSAQCGLRGYHLYLASYIYCPHIMSQGLFDKYLLYGDSRGQESIVSHEASI